RTTEAAPSSDGAASCGAPVSVIREAGPRGEHHRFLGCCHSFADDRLACKWGERSRHLITVGIGGDTRHGCPALSFRIPLVLVRTPGPRRLCTDQGSRCNHTAELPGRVRPSKGTLATMTSPSGSGTGTSPVLTITSTYPPRQKANTGPWSSRRSHLTSSSTAQFSRRVNTSWYSRSIESGTSAWASTEYRPHQEG